MGIAFHLNHTALQWIFVIQGLIGQAITNKSIAMLKDRKLHRYIEHVSAHYARRNFTYLDPLAKVENCKIAINSVI